jgi:hypothetical protein
MSVTVTGLDCSYFGITSASAFPTDPDGGLMPRWAARVDAMSIVSTDRLTR